MFDRFIGATLVLQRQLEQVCFSSHPRWEGLSSLLAALPRRFLGGWCCSDKLARQLLGRMNKRGGHVTEHQAHDYCKTVTKTRRGSGKIATSQIVDQRQKRATRGDASKVDYRAPPVAKKTQTLCTERTFCNQNDLIPRLFCPGTTGMHAATS